MKPAVMMNVSNFSQASVNAKVTEKKKLRMLDLYMRKLWNLLTAPQLQRMQEGMFLYLLNVQNTPTELGAGSMKSAHAFLRKPHLYTCTFITVVYLWLHTWPLHCTELSKSTLSVFFSLSTFLMSNGGHCAQKVNDCKYSVI